MRLEPLKNIHEMKKSFKGTIEELCRALKLEVHIKVAIRDCVRSNNEFVDLAPGEVICLLSPL